MKKVALAAAIALTASTAFAGGVEEPTQPTVDVVTQTAGSSGGILIPLLLLLVVAAAVAAD
jgi:hypothetical protein